MFRVHRLKLSCLWVQHLTTMENGRAYVVVQDGQRPCSSLSPGHVWVISVHCMAEVWREPSRAQGLGPGPFPWQTHREHQMELEKGRGCPLFTLPGLGDSRTEVSVGFITVDRPVVLHSNPHHFLSQLYKAM